MAATAADVPHVFDVVIDGKGFVFSELEPAKAELSFTPTFVPRQNVQGDYGDNFQDFWLSFTQRDWSLGEQQRYFRRADEPSRRYWLSTQAEIREPGQVTIKRAVSTVSFSSSPAVICGDPGGTNIAAASATNLFTVNAEGGITDAGAHSLGTSPTAIASDGWNIYLTSTGVGTVGVRRWSRSAFSTFSADEANALLYLNNTLYGYRTTESDLVRWDTSGTLTSLFTWKRAEGTAIGVLPEMTRWGSKIALVFSAGAHSKSELWIYDGVAPSLAAEFPPNFYSTGIAVVGGVILVSGFSLRSNKRRPTIYGYANGSVVRLWRSSNEGAATLQNTEIVAYDNGAVWVDDSDDRLLYYDSGDGGVHQLGSVTAGGPYRLAAGKESVLVRSGGSTCDFYPATTVATTATVTTSLDDFDVSLNKLIRGIRIEYVEGTDGDGGSIDIAYRVNDLDGSYTTLQTGAVSGTEYELSGITGRSVSVKVTLNKGTSTDGPVLKKIAVRAAPVQPAYRRARYVLNCSGRDGQGHVERRNEMVDGRDGLAMLNELKAIAETATPVSITDVLGTYTGVLELEGFRALAVRPEEFVVTVQAREV